MNLCELIFRNAYIQNVLFKNELCNVQMHTKSRW